ncbi:MAG: VapC toxin family PIN domain ribonuclease [Bacteroidetes bacterium CG12_big_fil_rev_8_21_14_0_65_60_17]|nr:MAG: VapC toxin family PIN domain ribonuclease [Bacteroidetes bacterium CG12_big_fil_rev_8_21_14_0_65_60_17]
MIIVDTSVWIDFFNGHPTRECDALESILGVEQVGIGDIILIEILQGIRSDADYRKTRIRLASLTIFDMLGASRAVQSANYFRMLRKKGITIPKTADIIIAGFCIDNGFPLLYSDRDFDPFAQHFGLKSFSAAH